MDEICRRRREDEDSYVPRIAVFSLLVVVVLEEVIDGVYRLTLPLPFRGTDYLNVYILKEEKPAVVDTGIGDQVSVERVLRGVEEAGVKVSDLDRIITTHEHIEHFGGNSEVKDRTGAEVFAHVLAADAIEGFHDAVLELGKLIDGIEVPVWERERLKLIMRFNLMVKVAKVDWRVKDGDKIDLGSRELRVIHTPGHSPGHICL
ncbi:MAG: MBL fold metallo-hydrolase, partial [Candidatus Freyarchaeota archaeon]|nr:MBL fold metallo-hydrolase [Candidatus Jordarchaeia archaeon]